ncbi:hypothetical protein [Pukyongiella litopenaei]|uniref:Transposase DDE domain-containing protein n=1 Tax=Pukyongiella litopenaei TaxID=2605946 RepID=A0A5C2H1H8_9RHOB|nr:hypothetical protein [Pukyongiella litopenaei]QEP30307.1 hypothetical protein C6Y53_18935 [Pukyongiella litopenaei]
MDGRLGQTDFVIHRTSKRPAHNVARKRRGSLTIWFDPEINWDAVPNGKRRHRAKKVAVSQPDPRDSNSLRDRRRRSGRKTLVQQTDSGDPDRTRHATWGMPVGSKQGESAGIADAGQQGN